MSIRTLLWLPVAFAALFTCSSCPTGAWSGKRAVTLDFLIVDAATGRPVPGVDVQLVHAADPEQPPTKGRTGPDGQVRLLNRFHAGGTTYLVGKTTSVRFMPWLIQVDASGFEHYSASLSGDDLAPLPAVTDPPLGLRYPAPAIIRLELRAIKP